MLDGETIEITAKAKITEEKQISDTLQQLFPDVEKIAQENKKADVQPDLENLSETLAAIGNEVFRLNLNFLKAVLMKNLVILLEHLIRGLTR